MPLRPAAAALAVTLALAACATAEPGVDVPAADRLEGTQTVEEATADQSAADRAGQPDGAVTVDALWWTAETVVDGDQFTVADHAGKNVVLWMWAPWCSVCNREAPEVADALADLPDDVTVIGVAGRDEVGAMRDFVAEHGLDAMTHVVDDDGAVWASYGISYQPAWVFIDGDGNASVAAGALGYGGLFEGIEQVFRR